MTTDRPTPAEIEAIQNRRVREYVAELTLERDEAIRENSVLRKCFCIADDENVVDSAEGSVLIDTNGGTRRRYFVATPPEREMATELTRLRAIVEPLEKLTETNPFWVMIYNGDRGVCVETKSHEFYYTKPTLDEALSAAVAAMDETNAAVDSP